MFKEIALQSLIGPQSGVVIFGGTFDPIHGGHVDLIRSVLAIFGKVIVAPTSQNPWKPIPPASFAQRLEMIRLALEFEGIPVNAVDEPLGVSIFEVGYVYAIDVVKCVKGMLAGAPLFWVVGEDLAGEAVKWRDFVESAITVLVAPIRIDVHASETRQGSKDFHPAIVQYIRHNNLYRS